MYTTTDFQSEERAKLWRDVLSVMESEENVGKALKVERNYAYDLFKSVRCNRMNIEEEMNRCQGDSMNRCQGESMNRCLGESIHFHDEHGMSVDKYLLVFLDGQTIDIEQSISTEKLYKPYELLNYPLDKDKVWLYNIKDLHCKHSVFSHMNDTLEILETCTRTQDIYKQPLNYDNKWLLISTIDFLNAYMNDLVQAVHECNIDKFERLTSSKAILINEIGEAYQISQDAALKIIGLDKYGLSTRNQTDLQTVYTEGGVCFKTLSKSMGTCAPSHEFILNALSRTLTQEQLRAPSMLLALVNVHLIVNLVESLPNEIKASQMSNRNIEEEFMDLSIDPDSESKDPIEFNNIQSNNSDIQSNNSDIQSNNSDIQSNIFIIHASRTIDTNDLVKSLDFDALKSQLTNDDVVKLESKNKMDKSGRIHLTSLALTFPDMRLHFPTISPDIFKILSTFEHLKRVTVIDSNIGSKECQYLLQRTSIRELNLSGNMIGNKGSGYLFQHTSIRELNMRWNNIENKGCEYLSLNTSIIHLNLSMNGVGLEGCQYLSLNTFIRVLDLSGNNLGPKECQCLSLNSTIRELDLSRNNIGDEGCQYLSLNTSIRELKLTKNKIGSKGCQYLSLNTSIRELKLTRNIIEEEGCQYLASSTSIRKLDVSRTYIRDVECQALLKSMFIRELILTGNYIGSGGCQNLSLNTSLRILNLSSNYIRPKGCQHLALNTSISVLDLSENAIRDQGCRYLSLNTSLRKLNVSNTKIRNEGCQYLSLITSLRELDLGSNQIGNEELARFSNKVKIYK